ncbi:MAG: T9SS type A sorting domain-containing protein [Flavobacteriales bacterium]|nr:T9SS type A sorting domain-containing protein [Flavobacteriales bacterium]
MKQKTNLLLALLFSPLLLMAQNTKITPLPLKIYFTYDNAGNQIKRSFDEPSIFSLTEPSDTLVIKNLDLVLEIKNKDSLLENFNFFPNPTERIFLMNWENSEVNHVTRITLTTIQGQVLLIKNINHTEQYLQWDLSIYAQGVYLINVFYSNTPKNTFKILKK